MERGDCTWGVGGVEDGRGRQGWRWRMAVGGRGGDEGEGDIVSDQVVWG